MGIIGTPGAHQNDNDTRASRPRSFLVFFGLVHQRVIVVCGAVQTSCYCDEYISDDEHGTDSVSIVMCCLMVARQTLQTRRHRGGPFATGAVERTVKFLAFEER